MIFYEHIIKILDHCALMCSDTENNLSYSQFYIYQKNGSAALEGRHCRPGLDFAENHCLSKTEAKVGVASLNL